MPSRMLVAYFLVLGTCSGCMTALKGNPGSVCPPPTEAAGPTIRVKAPPQKIVIEQPEGAPVTCPPPSPEKKEKQPESAPQPESEKEKRPETARQPERRPELEAAPLRQESAVGTLAALGQVASLTRTTAMTRPLGTINPGASALGLGIRWIHIPIPIPRFFSVEETPTVTVPLSEANLIPVGYGAATANGMVGEACPTGRRTLSRDEISALVAQELAAQRPPALRQEVAPHTSSADDADRRGLEKKLSEAEAQIEKLSNVLKNLDDRIPTVRPRPGN